jgi:hypothetical protein
MSRNLIEFHADDPQRYPAPYPASRGVPQWLKDMPVERPVQQQGKDGPETVQAPTVKQCPPFIEAMTCGYLVPLPGDVKFTMDASGALNFAAQGKIIDTQHPIQVQGSPFQRSLIVKFLNPWVVRTPPGYSTLFVPPLNQFELPFQVLSGVVETDTYYRSVHFPTVCLMRPGSTVTLKRGTPIAQVIPLKREDWQLQTAAWDRDARLRIETEMAADRHAFYKDRHWKKKSYG